jgi:tRNA-dihydrouridine synthase B
MVQATKKPVTVKIRAGVQKTDKWELIAKIAEEEGLQMITFHPRTVKQGYSGKSDWSLIKKLKKLVHIPIVGNGDVCTPEDVKRMLNETSCDYVMIGRAACKNPFLFTQINQFLETGKYDEITDEDRIKFFFKYLEYTKAYPSIKFANIKMAAMNFTKGLVGGKELRVGLTKTRTVKELERVLSIIS